MQRPEVVNIYTMGAWREGDVYIGRRGKKAPAMPGGNGEFGNPFSINALHNREDVIRLFIECLDAAPELVARLAEFEPKRLVCFCAPKACHGDAYADRLEALDGVNP